MKKIFVIFYVLFGFINFAHAGETLAGVECNSANSGKFVVYEQNNSLDIYICNNNTWTVTTEVELCDNFLIPNEWQDIGLYFTDLGFHLFLKNGITPTSEGGYLVSADPNNPGKSNPNEMCYTCLPGYSYDIIQRKCIQGLKLAGVECNSSTEGKAVIYKDGSEWQGRICIRGTWTQTPQPPKWCYDNKIPLGWKSVDLINEEKESYLVVKSNIMPTSEGGYVLSVDGDKISTSEACLACQNGYKYDFSQQKCVIEVNETKIAGFECNMANHRKIVVYEDIGDIFHRWDTKICKSLEWDYAYSTDCPNHEAPAGWKRLGLYLNNGLYLWASNDISPNENGAYMVDEDSTKSSSTNPDQICAACKQNYKYDTEKNQCVPMSNPPAIAGINCNASNQNKFLITKEKNTDDDNPAVSIYKCKGDTWSISENSKDLSDSVKIPVCSNKKQPSGWNKIAARHSYNSHIVVYTNARNIGNEDIDVYEITIDNDWNANKNHFCIGCENGENSEDCQMLVSPEMDIKLKEDIEAAAKLTAATSNLKNLFAYIESNKTVWKDASGKFNVNRLASDLTAGVVLGTVGGVVSGVVIKKKQVEKGFNALSCSVGGQTVAEWGDEFKVDFRK